MANINNQVLFVGGVAYTMVAQEDGSVSVDKVINPSKPTG